MFHQTINVAEIMREIKRGIISENNEIQLVGDLDSKVNRELVDIVNESNRINEFIENTRCSVQHLLPMGMHIPQYNSFPKIMRKPLVLISRCIRKASLFITREQTKVNYSVDACLKALTEYNQQVTKVIPIISQQNQLINELQQTINMQTEIINTLHNNIIKMNNNEEMEEKLRMIEEKQRKYSEVTEMDSGTYLNFENRFRGKKSEIKERLMYYLDNYIVDTVENKENAVILDLGCGRGEWLEVLQEAGYQCIGVDQNQSMIDECRKIGLEVYKADMFDYLKTVPDNSFKVVTAFQVVEHLYPQQIHRLFDELYRVVDQYGLIILETPNAANLEVGTNNFYLDPTHIRPVHQKYMEFLANEKGFYKTDIVYWKEKEINAWWDSMPNTGTDSVKVSTVANTVKNNFYISPDYALIAVK